MKLFPAIATLVLTLSLCNMFGNKNSTVNTNTNSSTPTNTTTNTGSTSSSSSSLAMSEDDKHKLFQAAGMTKDQATILEVSKKIGLLNPDNTPNDNFQEFIKGHMSWAMKNAEFVRSMNDVEKAKQYVAAHK
jgi:hypothetical protein